MGEEDFYFASVLALLRPWRHLQDLKSEEKTWREEGESFLEAATSKDRHIIAGLQYYYDTKTKVQGCNQDMNKTDVGKDNKTDLDIMDEDAQEEVRNRWNPGQLTYNSLRNLAT